MSRLLKQVYSENIYIQFRFESSLRKYDKKPTKKIKCEAYCRHCINHHRRTDASPCDSRAGFGSRSKVKRCGDISGERPEEKSVISEAKTIRLSKQKQPSPKRKELNQLEMNVYRDLMEGKKKEGAEENSSSMEDQIFFNEFGQGQEVQEESNKDSVDKDFDGIEIKRSSEQKREGNVVQTTSEKEMDERIEAEEEMGELIQEEKSEHAEEFCEPEVFQLAECVGQEEEEVLEELAEEKIVEQLLVVSKPVEPNNTLSVQQPQVQQPQQTIQQLIETCQPNQTQNLEDNIHLPSSQILQISLPAQNSQPHQIEEQQMGESMMDKCLVFQGGRIYVDTSGQNFYISVRVFNKLRRRYSDIEQLTSILIQQRPCLISKKQQIRHQLQQYLHTFQ